MHGKDDARHLLGGYASVAECQQREQIRTGLSSAAFWVHQRQDVFNAVIHQRTPKTDLQRSGLDLSISPADEHTWALRATCLNAEAASFCFGTEAASVHRFRSVTARLQQWYQHKPQSFTPVFYRERDLSQGRFFPDLYLVLDCCGKRLRPRPIPSSALRPATTLMADRVCP